MGLRLAQVVHHGTDHRSQVCTALTSFGITPPEIDLWAYGEATGRTRDVDLASGLGVDALSAAGGAATPRRRPTPRPAPAPRGSRTGRRS